MCRFSIHLTQLSSTRKSRTCDYPHLLSRCSCSFVLLQTWQHRGQLARASEPVVRCFHASFCALYLNESNFKAIERSRESRSRGWTRQIRDSHNLSVGSKCNASVMYEAATLMLSHLKRQNDFPNFYRSCSLSLSLSLYLSVSFSPFLTFSFSLSILSLGTITDMVTFLLFDEIRKAPRLPKKPTLLQLNPTYS